LKITRSGLNDLVVWNPAIEKAKAMADLGDEAWTGFVCAEAGQVDKPVKLEKAAKWEGGQVIQAL